MNKEDLSRLLRRVDGPGLLGLIPQLRSLVGCTQNSYHEHDVWDHTLAVVRACPEANIVLRTAALLHDVGKPESKSINPKTLEATFYDHEIIGEKIARSLLCADGSGFSHDEIERVCFLVRNHFIRYEKNWSDSAVRRWVTTVGAENVESLLTLARADIAGKRRECVASDLALMDEFEKRIPEVRLVVKKSELAVDGHDVQRILGLKPGPEVGKILSVLRKAVEENPEMNQSQKLVELVRQTGSVKVFDVLGIEHVVPDLKGILLNARIGVARHNPRVTSVHLFYLWDGQTVGFFNSGTMPPPVIIIDTMAKSFCQRWYGVINTENSGIVKTVFEKWVNQIEDWKDSLSAVEKLFAMFEVMSD